MQCLFKFLIGPIAEQDHGDLFQAGGFLDVGDDGAEGDGSGLVEGVAIDAGAERGEGDAGYFMLLGKVEAGLVGTAEQALVFISSAIDGADGVKDVFCGQSTCAGGNGTAGGTAADFATFGHDGWATGAVNGSIDATTTCEARVGGVDDGVGLDFGDITLLQG